MSDISIHALREEGDIVPDECGIIVYKFLSTPSARRATTFLRPCLCLLSISIHALREEGDRRCTFPLLSSVHFYPRPPRGGRRFFVPRIFRSLSYFYPRPPRGGRRPNRKQEEREEIFLSTPSARRATETASNGLNSNRHFYPRPPRGGRHPGRHGVAHGVKFLSTPSARRATSSRTRPAALPTTFLSTPSARRATL